MIFRKPYAILIKYFKLIHVLLTIIMAYLVYRTYNLFHFLSEYMKTTMLRLGKGATETMFNSYMYILFSNERCGLSCQQNLYTKSWKLL